MASLIKVIDKSVSLVETPLGLHDPLLFNNYDHWTQDPVLSWDISTPTEATLYSPYSEDYLIATISKQFTIGSPAHLANLTVKGLRNLDHEWLGGETEAAIILVKPDSSEIQLYYGTGETTGEIFYLNTIDIHTHLNQAGTYTLRLWGKVKSGYAPPSTYYISESTFTTVTLDLDIRIPETPGGLNAHGESSTQVHLAWLPVSELGYYKLYYKRSDASEWSYITTYDPEKILPVDSGIFYDFKIAAYNDSGESAASDVIQARSFGTFTQNFNETTTPAEAFAPNRIGSISLSETLTTSEAFSVQKLSTLPVSAVILLCGATTTHIYKFESGLVSGYFDSPEINFGYPDKEKTLVEVRFGSESPTPHTLTVYTSIDSGASWILLGSDTTGLGRTGFVYPWLTSHRFIVRFFGAGLHLYWYEVYAIPSGWKIRSN